MGAIVLIVFGAIIGGVLLDIGGAVMGGFVGLAFGMIASLKHRILTLEHALEKRTHSEDEKPFVAPAPQVAKAMAASQQAAELDEILEAAIVEEKPIATAIKELSPPP